MTCTSRILIDGSYYVTKVWSC